MDRPFSKVYGGKAGNCIMYKVRQHLKNYQKYKAITKEQNRDYAVSTERYASTIRWYDLIRSVLESWRDTYPNDAEIVAELYALGTHKTPMSAVNISVKHYVSSSTVYSIRHAFELEIAFRAIQNGLLRV